jgi:hypothetical protein
MLTPNSSLSFLNKLTIDMRRDAFTIETGSSTIKSVGLVNKALAMKIRYNCPPLNSFGYFRQFPDWSGPTKKSFKRVSKRGSRAENRHRARLKYTINDSDNHLAGNQVILKVMAATESGDSCTLAFPSLILTVCKGWLQMAFGFS